MACSPSLAADCRDPFELAGRVEYGEDVFAQSSRKTYKPLKWNNTKGKKCSHHDTHKRPARTYGPFSAPLKMSSTVVQNTASLAVFPRRSSVPCRTCTAEEYYSGTVLHGPLVRRNFHQSIYRVIANKKQLRLGRKLERKGPLTTAENSRRRLSLSLEDVASPRPGGFRLRQRATVELRKIKVPGAVEIVRDVKKYGPVL